MAPSADEYKLRQMILDEWHEKQTKEQAVKNIRDKLGKNAVTSAKVKYWYKRFDKGDTSIFNKNSTMRRFLEGTSIAGVSKDPINSILLTIDEKNLKNMLTLDGRLVIFPNYVVENKYYIVENNRYIVFYDLFHGVSKKIPSPFGWYDAVGMIGDFLLARDFDNNVCISKINYDTLTFGISKRITLDASFDGYGSELLLDRLNSNKFLLQDYRKFVIGQIENDEIVLGEVKNKTGQQSDLFGQRLMGNKLQGFTQRRDYSSMKFCEIDLDTMQMKQMDAPIVLDAETRHHVHKYCWSNNRCYAIDDYYEDVCQILLFDPQSCIWTNAQSLSKSPTTMFADSNDVLTLQVPVKNETSIFFRFANKKPDSLKNLAWFAILRNSKLFGGNIYNRIAHRLPYTCDLRCLISEENAEKP